jgi:hypothetical protein
MDALQRGLQRLPADIDPNKVADVLRSDGGLILEGLIPATMARAIDAELEPHLDQRPPGFKPEFDDTFYGSNTKRIQGIANKSRHFVTEILLHPTLLGAADEILRANCGDYWMSQAETIYIGPGNPVQELHRDDLNWANAATLGIDLQISVLTCLGDYDAAVGATRVIPGSHKWPLDRPFDPADAVPVELELGDALVYVGSLVHGGGHNTTTDRWRTIERIPQRGRELLGWSSLRGTTADGGAEGALQLWQLDGADLERRNGLFSQR